MVAGPVVTSFDRFASRASGDAADPGAVDAVRERREVWRRAAVGFKFCENIAERVRFDVRPGPGPLCGVQLVEDQVGVKRLVTDAFGEIRAVVPGLGALPQLVADEVARCKRVMQETSPDRSWTRLPVFV